MAELTVDMTYGTALMEAARETGKETLILEEGQQILDILEKEPDLQSFINYPAISADEKKKVLKNIFGGKVCDELLNFMFVLVDKRRTGRLEGIIRVYRDLIEKKEGYSYGTVYSVSDLSDERIAQIEEETSNLLQTKVKLTAEKDPNLMAGIKVMIDGRIIDASYRKKFDDMASQLKRN